MVTVRLTYDTQVNGCWLWTGALVTKKPGRDYGCKMVNRKRWMAHNLVYTLMVGPIPEGMELDHLCRTPRCVRPEHLEPVPHKTNVLRGESPAAGHARKTCCPLGHPYDGTHRNGRRYCTRCRKKGMRTWQKAHTSGLGTGGRQRTKTHCPQGHPYDAENTYHPPKRPNTRQCRTCTGRRPTSETSRRLKGRCINGHDLTPDNIRMEGTRRRCRHCEADRVDRRRKQRHAINGEPTHPNAAKTHCKRGHPLSGENLYVQKSGARTCKECKRMKVREWYHRNR